MPKNKTTDEIRTEKEFVRPKLETCDDYARYMEGDHDSDSSQKGNPVPSDAMSLNELSKLPRVEILAIANQMGLVENKSDIRVMYSNGYGFLWSDLLTVSSFLGFQISNPGERKTQFVDPEPVSEYATSSLSKNIVYIEHGKRKDTLEKKYTFSKDLIDRINELLMGLSNMDKSKAIEVILSSCIDECLEKKKKGKFNVAYKRIEEQILI